MDSIIRKANDEQQKAKLTKSYCAKCIILFINSGVILSHELFKFVSDIYSAD